MNSRSPRKSFCQKVSYFFSYGILSLISSVGGLPNVRYAMSAFPFDSSMSAVNLNQVTPNWVANLSPTSMASVIYCGASTAIVSTAFHFRFLRNAALKFGEEATLFRRGKNRKRFCVETSFALLSAISGSAIAGNSFPGEYEWPARILGFTINFALSFLGMNSLIITLTDKDYAFKLKISNEYLKRITPDYQDQVSNLLKNKELNKETAELFLNEVFTLANQANDEKPFFQKKSVSEFKKERCRHLSDSFLAGSLATFASTIYIQSGFSGVNFFSNKNLDDAPTPAKIFSGLLPGLPLALFCFFTIKFFKSPIFALCADVEKSFKNVCKGIALLGLTIGNGTWYYGLETSIVNNKTIFSFILETPFGKSVFPWTAFVIAFNMALNGLAPVFFPPEINIDEPSLKDIIKSLDYNLIPHDVVQNLPAHSFFTKRTEVKCPSIELAIENKPEGIVQAIHPT